MAEYHTVPQTESIPNTKKRLADGDHIAGIDIGRRRNQIVLCKIRVDSTHPDGFTIVKWGGIDFSGSDSLTNITRLLCILHEPSLECDYMCIEQQSSRNVWCFGLSHVLQAYMNLVHPACMVRHVSPRAKFTVLDPYMKFKRGSTYRAQKRWAVDLCDKLIENQEATSCDTFNTWEKKDDLADAFLYACAFLRQNRPKRNTTSSNDAVPRHPPVRPKEDSSG